VRRHWNRRVQVLRLKSGAPVRFVPQLPEVHAWEVRPDGVDELPVIARVGLPLGSGSPRNERWSIWARSPERGGAPDDQIDGYPEPVSIVDNAVEPSPVIGVRVGGVERRLG